MNKNEWLLVSVIVPVFNTEVLFIIGVIYDSPYNNGSICVQFIHIVLGSENNYLNMGLFSCA